MLPRRHRVPGQWFAAHRTQPQQPRQGVSFSWAAIRCYEPLTEPLPRVRCAVVVSRRVARRAVDRNRVRRRVYHALREVLPLLTPGVYVVQARQEARTTPFASMVRDLSQWARATHEASGGK